jgi:hypothetical protein
MTATVQAVLALIAVVAFFVAMIIGFDWVTSEKWPGWIALGLLALALVHVVPALTGRRGRAGS